MKKLKEYTDYELTQELEKRDLAVVVWSWIDVHDRAEEVEVEITEKQAKAIIRNIHRMHDCNYGITWDTIDYHIDETLINED